MNKYKLWHDAIIERASRKRHLLIFERHHILPKSLGGTNDPENIVELTPREHLVVHKLLTKFLTGRDRRLMLAALARLTYHSPCLPSWRFEQAREAFREARRGVKASPETRAKQRDLKLGGKHTAEHKAKICAAMKGRDHTWGSKISATLQANRKQCPHCDASICGEHNLRTHIRHKHP